MTQCCPVPAGDNTQKCRKRPYYDTFNVECCNGSLHIMQAYHTYEIALLHTEGNYRLYVLTDTLMSTPLRHYAK